MCAFIYSLFGTNAAQQTDQNTHNRWWIKIKNTQLYAANDALSDIDSL